MTSSQSRLHLDALASLAKLVGSMDTAVLALVAEARARGASWADIGGALGVTRQAAHARYSRLLGGPLQGSDDAPAR